MMRSTMDAWLQECPECGHVAAELDKASGADGEVVRSPGYQVLRDTTTMPWLSTVFVRRAMLEQAAGFHLNAAYQFLHAAWVADDEVARENSVAFRGRAADLWDQALAKGEIHHEEEAGTALVFVDVMRRAGLWDRALGLIARYAGQTAHPTMKSVFAFQATLIAKQDVAVHTMAEARK